MKIIIQTLRIPFPYNGRAIPSPAQPLNPSTQNTFEELDEDTSDLGFDFDSLPYPRPKNHIKAKLIIKDFLDIKSKGLRDHELWSLFRHAFIKWTADEFSLAARQAHGRRNKFTLLIKLKDHLISKGAIARDLNDLRNLTITKDAQKRKKSIEEAIKHKEELKAAKQSSKRSSRDSLPSPVPLLLQLPILSPKGSARKYEQALASNLNDLDGSDGNPEKRNKRRSEGNKHEGRGGGHGGPTKGQGNEPLRDLKRGYGPLDGPEPNRPFTYGTLSDLDDDDFPKLGTTDLYPRAKELALFARSFLKKLKTSLSECFEKLAKELKGIQGSLRPGLRDDKSLADKLYSAYKNVLKTTIARMNLAITSTAAIADIRRAIAFATKIIQPFPENKSLRPPAKASRAYASFSEPFAQHSFQHSSQHTSSKDDSDDFEDEYECFIQGCQYGGEHCEHFAK
ncbi:hypothetical protein MBM_05975 [Drepanopeziza brunnea f. sp. 'multigermtubi' MB_m1]|uniref:Uncharacterized protein n=1 Tax=Marssonina brunnea f. sp. multigermtubi (strain MB_m1) TaxID=1072389 RepID=K1XTP9_MARBU|nr:uncharacterized protein MBM_05975 [Drepanopeziza brunnea f. sp. 'multigermtubi' MB_m1]EKD15964.1 hypothetical protein MBM_05975 [Drepanopeziza brunnea f. sp. 'multigermtubi' MB_m1]